MTNKEAEKQIKAVKAFHKKYASTKKDARKLIKELCVRIN